jgi:hypothetical protein
MRTPFSWFVLLVAVCILAPYVFGVRPRRRRDWIVLALAIGFLAWLLAGFSSVGSF